MKRFFIAIIAGVLLMFSCTGNKTNQHEEVAADTVVDSMSMAEVDTLELLITETPMPRAADAMFDDFLFNFLANKKLQKERIIFPLRVTEDGKTETIEQDQWKMEHLFINDTQLSLMKDTAVSEAIVEKIMLKKWQVSSYYFQRIKGAWMLREVRVTPIDENSNLSFLAFYKRFVTDSVYQVESINETVQFTGPDPDDDFNVMEGVITPDTWEAFAPQLPAKLLYNIVYGKPEPEGNQKIFLMRGVANGLELELRFKRVGGRWKLMKMTT